jgi:hypothetical protein
VGDIDRTQPGLMNKSVLDGEWFMRRTIIDAPYDTGYTFIGEQDEVSRVHWEIQKTELIAWRVLPEVDGTQDAAPMAVFAIESHVDVKREYNPSTGEQTNVVYEDTTDRPWYDRTHIRVDWSRNLVTNFHFWVEGLDQDPVAYFIESDSHPDAFLMGSRQADGAWTDVQNPTVQRDLEDAHYLDVVTRSFVKPEQFGWEDWYGHIYYEPACWYYGNYDCAPTVVTIRNSFLRTDQALSDYEELDYPDNRVSRDVDGDPMHVAWNAEGDLVYINDGGESGDGRPGEKSGTNSDVADPYGFYDASKVRLPFFDKFGYFRTERFGYDTRYGEVESERTFLINRWNIWAKTHDDQGARIPYAERTVKPIVYYLSPDFPQALVPAAQETVAQWNDAFRETVGALTGWENPPAVFLLKSNSRTVDAATGDVLTRGEANGDLRYSHLWLVDQPTRVGLLGYGPSAIDPVSGEVFAADAYVYGAAVWEYAALGKDIISLINGDLTPEELGLGENIQSYLALLGSGGSQSKHPAHADVQAFAAEHRSAGKPHAGPGGKKARRKPSTQSSAMKKGIEKFKRPAGWASSRLQAVQSTGMENLLASDPSLLSMKGMGLLASSSSFGALPKALQQMVSPVNWASPDHRHKSLAKLRGFAERNMLMATFVDDAVAGLAADLADEDPDGVVDLLRSLIFKSTAEHEIGHTLGLRHNFEASTDALNFPDTYWQMRGANGSPLQNPTTSQIAGKIKQVHYSSIMDYHGRFNTDVSGIGRYDRAAIKFGYGQLIECFWNNPDDPMLDLVDWGDGSYGKEFTLDEVLRKWRHYTRIPEIMGGLEAISDRYDLPYTYEAANLMGMTAEDSYQAQAEGVSTWIHEEVPYRFCSDEYVFGTQTCNMFDLGADPAEIVQDATDRYWSYYWFNNFKRDHVIFDEFDYMDYIWWRYFAFIKNFHDHWVFGQWYDADVWEYMRYDAEYYDIDDVPWEQAGDAGLTLSAASMRGMTFLSQVIATPAPGAYWYDFDEDYWWSFDSNAMELCDGEWSWDSEYWCADWNLELGDGRYFESIYDVESGYYFYERLKWIGSFYDKMLALEAMTTPDTYFLGIDTAASVDQWAISMFSSYPKEMMDLFSGVAADWFFLFSGTFTEDGDYLPPDPFAKGQAKAVYEDGGPIDPQTSFTLQLYALWYGMAWLNANYDNSFNDAAKIWLKDSGEGLSVADESLLVEFADPFNNRIYVASWPSDPDLLGTGAAMLTEATYWLDRHDDALLDPESDADTIGYYKWRVTNMIENVEVVRGLHELYGNLYF